MPHATYSARVEERFWAKVDAGGDCWEWTASRFDGYGRFGVAGRQQGAHRVAYEILVGPIPADLVIDHLCRNRGCVNPDHLEPVTPEENRRRGIVDRERKHCPRGHLFTPENVYISSKGRKECRICRAASHRDRRARDAMVIAASAPALSTTQREAVLAFLREHPGATMPEIARGIGKPYYLIEPEVRTEMLRAGDVVREPTGLRAPRWRYYLSAEERGGVDVAA